MQRVCTCPKHHDFDHGCECNSNTTRTCTRTAEGKDITDDALKKETATLTKKQAAAVKRRVETLNATRRKAKERPEVKTDVRDVFAGDVARIELRDTHHSVSDAACEGDRGAVHVK